MVLYRTFMPVLLWHHSEQPFLLPGDTFIFPHDVALRDSASPSGPRHAAGGPDTTPSFTTSLDISLSLSRSFHPRCLAIANVSSWSILRVPLAPLLHLWLLRLSSLLRPLLFFFFFSFFFLTPAPYLCKSICRESESCLMSRTLLDFMPFLSGNVRIMKM